MDDALRVQKLHPQHYLACGRGDDRQIGASGVGCPEPASGHSILHLQADGEHSPEHLMQVAGICVSDTRQCLETMCTDTSGDNIGGAQHCRH